MDTYFDINVTYTNLESDPIRKISVGAYDIGRGRNTIATWILGRNILDQEVDDILTVVKTMLLARLDVQLGLDLGLIS